MGVRHIVQTALVLLWVVLSVAAEEPTPNAQNTITVKLQNPVKPQTFSRPIKFFVENVIDRSANPQPLLVYKPRGGIFLDRQPSEIVRQALTETLQSSDLLAPNRESADYSLTVYLFHFGLATGSGVEFFGKVDLNVVVREVASGKSQEVTALGTSIQGGAFRKKSIQKNVEANINEALESALRNFLRGTKLRDAVAAPSATPSAPATTSPSPSS